MLSPVADDSSSIEAKRSKRDITGTKLASIKTPPKKAIATAIVTVTNGTGECAEAKLKSKAVAHVVPSLTEIKSENVPQKRLLLVTGCARSASGYISAVLQVCGLDVKHEAIGRDGCVSWTMAVESRETPWGPPRDGSVEFEHVFHQVRHPLAVISSVWTTEGPRSWGFIPTHVPKIRETDSIEVRCAKYWYYWNRTAGRLAEWTYRIEDLANVWPELCQRLGRKLDVRYLAVVSKTINARNTKPPSRVTNILERDFTWQDLRKLLKPRLFNNICKLAQRYGYAITDDTPPSKVPVPVPTTRSVEIKSGVRVVIQKRLLLVIGSARSGSAYTAAVLNACGMSVGHELMESDGCVSWVMVVPAVTTPWGPARDGSVEFKHIFHQVRHPLAVMSSVWTTEGPVSWEFICKHVPQIKSTDSPEVRCAKYWIYWNKAAERQAEWTYRVEDLETVWPQLCHRLGKQLDAKHIKTVPTSTNARGAKPLSRGVDPLKRDFTWDDLRGLLKPRLFVKLCKLAHRYGYTVPDNIVSVAKTTAVATPTVVPPT
jgi:hypothetical protein